MTHMTKTAAAPLLALACALGGCGEGTYNPGLESVHQPVVNRVDYVLDLRANGGDLAVGESARLATWFDNLALAYGDRVAIDDPAGYNAEARNGVAGQAARYGLLLSSAAPVTAGAVPEGSLRVVVSRMSASVPGCPDWSRPSHPEYGGSATSNYGCASATNLAAMIANPEDLVRGREIEDGLTNRAGSRAINTYRAKPPTGAKDLKVESTGEGD